MPKNYLFQSERLGFRNWLESDLDAMAAINADPEVMRFFPRTANREQTAQHMERMQGQLEQRGYCYFAVDELASDNLIGFIGLALQDYDVPFSPFTDIGWRLGKAYWGKGFATEGAKACLTYGFQQVGLKNIKAVAPTINLPSINVMKKIGMTIELEFKHPKLKNHPRLETCALYQISK